MDNICWPFYVDYVGSEPRWCPQTLWLTERQREKRLEDAEMTNGTYGMCFTLKNGRVHLVTIQGGVVWPETAA